MPSVLFAAVGMMSAAGAAALIPAARPPAPRRALVARGGRPSLCDAEARRLHEEKRRLIDGLFASEEQEVVVVGAGKRLPKNLPPASPVGGCRAWGLEGPSSTRLVF